MAVARKRPASALLALALLATSMLISGVALADGGATSGGVDSQWHLIHVVSTLIIGVYTWVSTGQKASDRDVAELRTRIATVEADMKHIPTEADGREVLVAMSAQQSKLEALIGQLETMSSRFERYEAHMIARNS